MMDQQTEEMVLAKVRAKLRTTAFGEVSVELSDCKDYVDVVTIERSRVFKDMHVAKPATCFGEPVQHQG